MSEKPITEDITRMCNVCRGERYCRRNHNIHHGTVQRHKGKRGRGMIILKKGERADTLWGMSTEYITDKEIEALRSGRRLWLSVNDEYAVVIKYKGGDTE